MESVGAPQNTYWGAVGEVRSSSETMLTQGPDTNSIREQEPRGALRRVHSRCATTRMECRRKGSGCYGGPPGRVDGWPAPIQGALYFSPTTCTESGARTKIRTGVLIFRLGRNGKTPDGVAALEVPVKVSGDPS